MSSSKKVILTVVTALGAVTAASAAQAAGPLPSSLNSVSVSESAITVDAFGRPLLNGNIVAAENDGSDLSSLDALLDIFAGSGCMNGACKLR